jgi:hypothetical protein
MLCTVLLAVPPALAGLFDDESVSGALDAGVVGATPWTGGPGAAVAGGIAEEPVEVPAEVGL